MVTHSITGLAKTKLATTRSATSAGGLRAGLMGCVALACVAGVMAPLNSATAQSGPCLQTPTLDEPPAVDQPPAALPVDFCEFSVADRDFYEFAWQMFKFLVWPAASGHRGQPDTTKSITIMDGARVFESFKADWEVFRPGAEHPGAWNASPSTPCRNQPDISPGSLVLASFDPFDNIKTGERSDRHVLVAQNQSYVRYQSGYNEILFERIVGNGLYDASVVRPIPRPQSTERIDARTESPNKAMTVKSAWIELPGPSGSIDQSKFYIRHRAWVQVPGTDQCREANVGLVGLHVVYKTESRPQWIWSTFEHVDNVPELGGDLTKSYTFYNGSLGERMAEAPGDLFRIPPAGVAVPGDPPRPYQVERRQEIAEQVLRANEKWQNELGRIDSVWRNYRLVMSQWPFLPLIPEWDAVQNTPMPACNEANITPATANTTMETFQQRCLPTKTCMGCHNLSRKTDFIWSIPR